MAKSAQYAKNSAPATVPLTVPGPTQLDPPEPPPSDCPPALLAQYSQLGQDLRFYADQRFKILTAFTITSALIANVAKDVRSPWIAAAGIAFAYFCLSWEDHSARWWYLIFKAAKDIEARGIPSKEMIEIYGKYPTTRLHLRPNPSRAVRAIYFLGVAGWGIFLLDILLRQYGLI